MPASDTPRGTLPPFLTSDEALAVLTGYFALDDIRRTEVRDLVATLLKEQAAESRSRSETPQNPGERRSP